MAATRTPTSFTVGWVCALPVELAAAGAMMDEEYEDLPQPSADTNIYTYGRIGVHNVVAACLPAGQMGYNSAAIVASQMRNSFPSLRFGVLVGIGGGVPSDEHDIRLGDIVISQPAGLHGGVVQFDFGKTGLGGQIIRTGSLNAPPTILLNALAKLRANDLRGKACITDHLSAFSNLPKFAYPGSEQDKLYAATSQHVGPTCARCSEDDIVPKYARATPDPVLFFGTIASGNQLIRDAPTRDRISQDLGGILCFEMEAAGLMNNFPCLVVRGICDYADVHTNEQWQPYAAATAAACTKELLRIIPPVVSTGDIQKEALAPEKHSAVPLLSDEQRDCLRSLSFQEQESRYHNIHSAKDTCEWLLEDSQYQAWIKKPRGLFWVRGNPGAGKSVLMKFAVTAMGRKQAGDLVLSFFINGRGTLLQKSPLGVFRALLNSMLTSFPQYLSQLTKIFEDRERRYGSYQMGRWNWATEELQEFMSKTLREGTKNLPVVIFIDALDECGERNAKELLTYFKNLMKDVEQERAQLKICFSSRHYPILGLNTIPTIFVEERNDMDIQFVIRERLKEINPEVKRKRIEEEILLKAQGGFQWAILVTGIVLDGDTTGIKEERLLEKLTTTPETLDELYTDILNDSTEVEKQQMIKLFQWVVFAERPLSSQELREALITDKDMVCTTVSHLRNHDSWIKSLDQFETYVKHISKGLVGFQTREIWEQYEPNGETWDREAQFVHQSVADYILNRFLKHHEQYAFLSPVGAGHFEISRSCLRYVMLSEVLDGIQLPRGTLSAQFPLLPYIVQFLFHHIQKVEQEGIPQLDLLTLLQWDKKSESIQKLASLWRILDPHNAYTPIGWPFVGATPLHVLVTLGSKSAFDAFLKQDDSEIDGRDLEGNTPLLLAIRQCHPDMALALLDRSIEWQVRQQEAVDQDIHQSLNARQQMSHAVNINAENYEGDTPLTMALTSEVGEVIIRLIEAGADFRPLGQEGKLVFHAIRTKNKLLLKYLIEKKFKLDGAVYFTLQELSYKNDDVVLEEFLSELLKAGANTIKSSEFDMISGNGSENVDDSEEEENDINTIAGDNSEEEEENDLEDDAGDDSEEDEEHDLENDAILLASRRGQTTVINLFLSNGVSGTYQDKNGCTPVYAASNEGHIQVVELLLEKGVDLNIADIDGRTPLYAASINGHSTVVEFLLEKGADQNIADRNGWTPLHAASSNGHSTVVELLLAQGADLNIATNDRSTPLFIASNNGNSTVVELLLEKGATLNTANTNGWTPLNGASDEGNVEVVKLLLEKGADLNIADNKGWTPLYSASEMGHFEIVELLVEKGADINVANNNRSTPLYAASRNGHSTVVELLLENGADLNIPNKNGSTPLYSASSNGYRTVVDLLLEKGTALNTANADGWTPINAASRNGHRTVVELLLEKGADPNIADNKGWTPICSASVMGHSTVVELLLKNGADLTIADIDGWTPLYAASKDGHSTVVKLLLEEGADLNTANNNGRTPLNSASERGHLEVVKLLLEKGADLNIAINNDRWTSLFAASSNGHIAVVELLLENGADLNIPTNNGWTPLYAASRNGRSIVVKLLLESGVDLNIANIDGRTPLYAASNNGYGTVVELLLEKGADPNIADRNGWTPLYAASSNGYSPVVEVLLENGANLNIVDIDGWTPLYAASRKGHGTVVKLLLEKGTDLNTANNNGQTPLKSASKRGHLEVVKLLLEKGADLNTANNNGQTPLNSASEGGHLEVVKLLLEKGADLNIANNDRWTPLYIASNNADNKMVELLLEKDPDLNITNNDGHTPLYTASSNGHSTVVQLLLEKGADLSIANNNGLTPLCSASSNGHNTIVELLLEKGADLNIANNNGWTPLCSASNKGHNTVVDLLLEKGADLNIASKSGWTPLCSASCNGHSTVVELLLKKGANLNLASKRGWTPLCSASSNGHSTVVKLLLEKGADLNTANDDGWTPLNSASDRGHIDVVKLLLEKGADLNLGSRSGWTPICSAFINGHIEIVDLLLKEGADLDLNIIDR